MGLALLIVVLKTVAVFRRNEFYNNAARFWIRIFAINFAVGVVTGIPMEFQFGTNWAGFSKTAGGVIGQTLAMEGVFSFFSNPLFWACWCTAKSGWAPSFICSPPVSSFWVLGCRDSSSSRPTPGCSTP
jgi:cytochrome bd-type quinol oxidase subunit 1